jgi:flavin-dependent dehydrogenase
MIEAVVVGAGPAGAVAATLLARAGVRVLVLDRAAFPRPKLCGDTVNPGALSLLRAHGLAGVLDREGLSVPGMLVTGPRGVAVRATYGDGVEGRALTRERMDVALVEMARAAGARVEEGVTVKDALIEEQGPSIRVRGVVLVGRDGRSLRVPAGITIAADGRHSTLAFRLGLAQHPDRPRRWAVGAYYTGVERVGPFGEMHVRRDHYVGVAPLPGGLTNACLVTSARDGLDNPDARLREALDRDGWLRDRFAGAQQVAPAAVLGPLAVDATAPGVPGLLLAGDAAGFIDPMTGDGLRFALRGAELAAAAARRALEGDHRGAIAHLTAARQRAFRAKWRFNRILRALVSHPAGIGAAGFAARLAPAGVRLLIRSAADLPR